MPIPTPISARLAIRRARQGILLADFLTFSLTLLSIVGFVFCLTNHYVPIGTGALFALPVAWFAMALRTARNQEGLLRVPSLIEARHYEEAEKAIAVGLGQFSLVRGPRLQAMQQLTQVRFAQKNFAAAQHLAQATLRFRLPAQAVTGAQLLLAECSLETGDLFGAHAALGALRMPLALRDSLKLLELQTDYCVRISAWGPAIEDLPAKVELAELLPTDAAARVQAGLGLASLKMGHREWATWLRHRCELLSDAPTLVDRRPILAELFA